MKLTHAMIIVYFNGRFYVSQQQKPINYIKIISKKTPKIIKIKKFVKFVNAWVT